MRLVHCVTSLLLVLRFSQFPTVVNAFEMKLHRIGMLPRHTIYFQRRSQSQRSRGNNALAMRHRRKNSPDDIYYEVPDPAAHFVVMGGGSFGLAMASVIAFRGVNTTILVRDKGTAEIINTERRHPTYLSDLQLPDHVAASTDHKTVLRSADYIIHAVPVQFSRSYLKKVRKYIPSTAPVLSVSKGIETKSCLLMCELLEELLGSHRSYAYLSGPSFAREIMEGKATAVTVASTNVTLSRDFRDFMTSPNFRVFTTSDVIGVEVGGAVKNVIALAAGMSEGLGLGTNAMAALVTIGCLEMRRLSSLLGGKPSTLAGLSGVGDTFGTCFGPLSRNRNLGIRLGKGEKLKDILKSSTEVAEGVDTAYSLAKLIKRTNKSYRTDLKFPIVLGVCEILKGKITAEEGLESMMSLPLRMRFEISDSDHVNKKDRIKK